MWRRIWCKLMYMRLVIVNFRCILIVLLVELLGFKLLELWGVDGNIGICGLDGFGFPSIEPKGDVESGSYEYIE